MKIAPGPTFPPGATCYVDLTGFFHRLAYMPGPHGMNPKQVISKVSGEPTWGVVGTFNQLNTLAKQRPARVIAIADSSQDGFRTELSPSYKRKTGSPYLSRQLARLAQCCSLLANGGLIGGDTDLNAMHANEPNCSLSFHWV